ncbi:MAG: hypothetical protein HYV33_02495 [Candidatus Kerfeldbacteria bacterium]|nr:hypothetical protein [Candidatus Kerfeldbacteria bacterium]
MSKFFLYARKSTDEPNRQILSIEAQITELREFGRLERPTAGVEGGSGIQNALEFANQNARSCGR